MADCTGPWDEPPRRRRRNPGHRPPEPKVDRLARGRSARLRRLREALRAQLRQHETERDPFPALDTETKDGDLSEEPEQIGPPPEDDLPEHITYRDTGCHKSPSCLACPLPRCIFDRPTEHAREARIRRDRTIRALAHRGWSTGRIARRFGISPAQVRRIRGPRRKKGE